PYAMIGGTAITLPPTVDALEANINQPTFTPAQILAAAQSFGFTTVQQLGPDNLVEVRLGANLTLAGSLVKGNNSVVLAGAVLNVAGNPGLSRLNFTSTAGAVIDLDTSFFKAPGDFVFVGPAATMSLTGTLLTAVESIVASGANVVQVAGGTITTANTLLSLTRSHVVAPDNLVRIVNGGQVVGTTPNPLDAANAAQLTVSHGPVFNVRNGALAANVFVDPAFVAFVGLSPDNTITGVDAERAIVVLEGAASQLSFGANPALSITIGTGEIDDFRTGAQQVFSTVTITGGT